MVLVTVAALAVFYVSLLVISPLQRGAISFFVFVPIQIFSFYVLPFVGYAFAFRYSRWLSPRSEMVRWGAAAALSVFVTVTVAFFVGIGMFMLGG